MFLVTTLPTNPAMIADISGDQYNMLRLFGLLACVLLAFVFPILAYEYNQTAMSLNIISTVVSSAIVIGIFPGSNFNTKTQKKCVVLVGDDQTIF